MPSDPWFWQSAEQFAALRLGVGKHNSPANGVCLMEAVAWLARERHSDSPKCVCPVLAAYGRSLNDGLDDEGRQRLKPLIPAVIGTAGDGHADARGLMAMDWIIRVYTPTWLALAGLDAAAADLRALPEVDRAERVQGSLAALGRARDAAMAAAMDAARDAAMAAAMDAARAAAMDAAMDAAWDASMDAAMDAAWDAARAAAMAAARDAAMDAAWDAAMAAAMDAAMDAARAASMDAAWDALAPTVVALQDSAIELYERMIALGAEERVARPLLSGLPELAPEARV